MESVDFYEVFGAAVECPECGEDIELDLGASRYQTGEKVVCTNCKHEFILGESL